MKHGRILSLLLILVMLLSLAAPLAYAASEAEELGLSYYRGTNGEQNYSKALEYMTKAEKEGSTEVLFPLGEIYERGLGVKADMGKAVIYYMKAAENGNEQARERLRQEPMKSYAAVASVRKQATHVLVESGDVEGVRGPTYPFYLDKPLVNAKDLSMVLSMNALSGYPYGWFYLYVKDAKGNWHHTSHFKIDKSMADGHYETFELKFDQVEPAIVALAICPEEKGMDYVADFDVTFITSAENVGEYSSSIPAPVFTPASDPHPVASFHTATAAYSSPLGGINVCPDVVAQYNNNCYK